MFTVAVPSLPVAPEEPERGERPAPALEAQGDAKVLVVEDDRQLSELLLDLLRGEGFHAVAVADGVQALRYLRRRGRPRGQ